MYIVRRMGHVEGIAAIGKAVEVTQIVQNAGVPVSLWVGDVGMVPGTVVWSLPVESFAEWSAHTETLAADAAYMDFAEKNIGTITITEPDVLSEVVHGAIEGRSEVGEYLGSIEATIEIGREGDAAAFAVEAADAFTAATGLPAVVVKNLAGEQGTIAWLVRYGPASAIDEAEAKTGASADYAAVLTKSGGLFSTGVRLFARRTA